MDRSPDHTAWPEAERQITRGIGSYIDQRWRLQFVHDRGRVYARLERPTPRGVDVVLQAGARSWRQLLDTAIIIDCELGHLA